MDREFAGAIRDLRENFDRMIADTTRTREEKEEEARKLKAKMDALIAHLDTQLEELRRK